MTLPFDKAARPDLRADEIERLEILYKAIGALKETEARLKPVLGRDLSLSIIDTRAVRAFGQQWQPFFEENQEIGERYYGTWSEHFFVPKSLNQDYLIDNIWNFDDPAAFNVAIWHGDRLAGVGRGGYEDEHKRGFVSVQLREADPRPDHALKGKIGAIIHEAAISHAKAFGADKVYYIGPFSPGAVKVHESMGFTKQIVELRPGDRAEVYLGPVIPKKSPMILPALKS